MQALNAIKLRIRQFELAYNFDRKLQGSMENLVWFTQYFSIHFDYSKLYSYSHFPNQNTRRDVHNVKATIVSSSDGLLKR